MITDFPEAKKAVKKVVDSALRQKVKENTPALSMIDKRILHEGNKLGVLHDDGKHVVNDLQYIQSEFMIPYKDVPTMKAADFMEKVTAAAVDMAGQMERGLFQKMDESAKESGNVLSSKELTPDTITEALEKVDIDFEDDDRAKPIRPSLFTDPVSWEKLKEKIDKITPEQKEIHDQREKAIMDKKYEEYMKDLNSRKIID